jgi:site-specific recombinase XerD
MRSDLVILGEYNPDSETHRATDAAIRHSPVGLKAELAASWISTATIKEADILQAHGPEYSDTLAGNRGLVISGKDSAATIKQHMAAIRMMFSWLTEKGILAINPAREVKTPKFSRTEGKTPAFSTEEVQKVLNSIDTSHVVGHRDKALLATLAYTFARIGAVVNLKGRGLFSDREAIIDPL